MNIIKNNIKLKNATNVNSGFTIIELLVVVAIIAVLTAIVMSNTTRYSKKGNDTAIKGILNNAFISGTIYFAKNGDFANFCDSPEISAYGEAIGNAGGKFYCYMDDPEDYCVCSELTGWGQNDQYPTYCVDSYGTKEETNPNNCQNACHYGQGYCNPF